jgi:hypothetical protein
MTCRATPRRQRATIPPSMVRSMRSTVTSIPRTTVLKGNLEVLLDHREEARDLLILVVAIDSGLLDQGRTLRIALRSHPRDSHASGLADRLITPESGSRSASAGTCVCVGLRYVGWKATGERKPGEA